MSGPFDPEMKQAGQLTSPTWELELFGCRPTPTISSRRRAAAAATTASTRTSVPVDSLPRGRHTIGVMPDPPETLPSDSAALRAAAWKQPFVIPFWR